MRAHIDAFRAQDVERSVSFCDPYVVQDLSRLGPAESEAAYGTDAMVKGVRRWVGTFEEYDYEVESLTDLGCGQVLALVTETGRGKGSGVPVDRSVAVLYTVIGGKIARITSFTSEGEAREAVGVR